MSGVVEFVRVDFNGGALLQPPERFTAIGSVVQTEGGPSFQKLGVLLHPNAEVRPGEFLAVWHGHRGKVDVLTVLQVDDCVEVNRKRSPSHAFLA